MSQTTASRPARRIGAAIAATGLALAGVLVATEPAHAATFAVTSSADDGAGSLREAVGFANAADGVDRIEIAVGAPITLDSFITITDGVEIVGLGKDATTVTRSTNTDLLVIEPAADVPQAERVFSITGVEFDGTDGTSSGAGVFVSDTSELIESLDLTDVRFTGFDGGVNERAVTVEHFQTSVTVDGGSEFFDNDNTGDAGAALYVTSGGTLTIENTVFSDNSAVHGGGAVYLREVGVTEIAGSSFDANHSTNNWGGAVLASGEISVRNSLFAGNTAFAGGGAIGSIDVIELEVIDSVFESNSTVSAGGAMYIGGISDDRTLIVSGSTFTLNEATGGDGAAISIGTVAEFGRVVIRTSEFAENSADEDGAVFAGTVHGDLMVIDSTFAANDGDGTSGLHVDTTSGTGEVAVVQSTFDEQQAAVGITQLGDEGDGAFYAVLSTIVGDPAIRIGSNDADDAVISHSIVQGIGALDIDVDGGLAVDADWSVFAHERDPLDVSDVAGNQFETDPMLAPLAENGGPTRTMLLLEGSPALDAGQAGVGDVPDYDQRGAGFPRVVNDRIDIGAVEMPAPILPATGATVPTIVPFVAGGVLLLGILALVGAGIMRRRRAG